MKLKVKLIIVAVAIVLIPMLVSTFIMSSIVRRQNDTEIRNKINETMDKLNYTLRGLEIEYLNKVRSFANAEKVVLNTGLLFKYKKSLNEPAKKILQENLLQELKSLITGMNLDVIKVLSRDNELYAIIENRQSSGSLISDEITPIEILDVESMRYKIGQDELTQDSRARFRSQGEIIGYRTKENELLLQATAPIKRKNEVVGVVVLGKSLDAKFVEEMAFATGAEVAFFVQDKYIVGTLPEFAIPPKIKERMDSKPSLIVTKFKVNTEPFNFALSPIFRDGQLFGVIAVGLSNVPTIEKTAQTRRVLFIIATIGILLAVVVVYLWAGTVVRPVKHLVQGAEAIEDGDLEHKISVESSDEIGELASKFNEMTRSLKQSRDKLEEINKDLFYLKEYNENVVESIAAGIIVVDKDMKITMVNRGTESEFGIGREEVIGKEISQAFPSRNSKEFLGVLLKAIKTWEPYELSDIKRKTDQGTVVNNVRIYPLKDSGSKIVGSVIIVDNVTEKVQLQERLTRSEKLASVGQLSAGVAHEINNPLGVILNFIQILLKKPRERKETQEYLTRIEKETKRIARIVQGLLDFARQSKPDFSSIHINRVLEETLILTEYQILLRNIKIVKKFSHNLPQTMGDAGRLKQVFINIIMNAAQAMPEGGTLTIATTRSSKSQKLLDKANFIEISFRDTGCGIPEEYVSHLFDPFFSTKEGSKYGTGLGLSISYGIIEEHHGSIDVKSEPGKGTAFTIKLPIRIEEPLREKMKSM